MTSEACSCTCGGGTKRRNRVIQQSPRHGGKLCQPEDKGEIAPCATQTCDICVDGRWSEWGSWSSCSATCASSYKARHRSVDRHPNFCGKPAVGLEDQYEVCKGQPNCIPDRVGSPCVTNSCSGHFRSVSNQGLHSLCMDPLDGMQSKLHVFSCTAWNTAFGNHSRLAMRLRTSRV
ncbi:Thbs2 [Symbiodinium pilosum]|uniref:Thbs2 protein n=1 Tax=Symbiodinium pilosum TaxID=2952 RepID=A0A812KG24_SYMPI|nr:Thbs2 [Symbiodinium pilosum]